jgi:uncharacterized protein (TIGR03437 family)
VLAGSAPPVPVLPVSVSIGGQSAALVSAGGITGLSAGIAAVRATVPAGLASGPQSVVVTVGGVASQSGVTVSVK